MRVEDAPPAGWYPDPEGGSRLRWWQGTDWSDRYRAPPTPGVVEIKSEWEQEHGDASYADQVGDLAQYNRFPQRSGLSRNDTSALVNEVRMAARQEAERAVQQFGYEARRVGRELSPLISQYTSRFMRWVRFLSTVAVVLLIAWLAFQLFAQASLFEWIGDRIDNLTDNIGNEDGARAVGGIYARRYGL